MLHGVLCGSALLLAHTGFAATPNLCREQEDALFACPLTSGKSVAVCAVYDPALKAGYSSLVYRFGTPGHVDITLPEKPEQFRQNTFADEMTAGKPMEDDQYVRFVHGPYSYVAYMALGKGFDVKGLAVFEGDRLRSKLACEPGTLEHDTGQNGLVSLGVQPETKAAAMRFWGQLLPGTSAVLPGRSSQKSGSYQSSSGLCVAAGQAYPHGGLLRTTAWCGYSEGVGSAESPEFWSPVSGSSGLMGTTGTMGFWPK